MKEFFKHIFTGKDNQTYDIGRVLWAAGVLAFIGMAIYHVYAKGEFDASSYGLGFGSVLAGGGTGVGVKSMMKSEPE